MAASDIDQRTCKDTHLIVAKGIASHIDFDQPAGLITRRQVGVIADAPDFKVPNESTRMRGLAMRRAKALKVMLTHEMTGGVIHRLQVQAVAAWPHPTTGFEQRRDSTTTPDAVEVAFAENIGLQVPVFVDFMTGEDAHTRRQSAVERNHQSMRLNTRLTADENPLITSVHARVRARGTDDLGGAIKEDFSRLSQGSGHRRMRRL